MKSYYWLPILLACLAVTIPSALSSPFTITGDNFLVSGVNFTEQVFVENSVNGTFANCSFTTDGLITTNSTLISATYNYWGSSYAPDSNISTGINITPWFIDETLTNTSSNYRPVLSVILSQNTNVGHSFSYQTVCTDQNMGDILVYSDNTTLFNINPSNGLISFTYSSIKAEKIRITCSDSLLEDTKDFKLTIGGYAPFYQASDITGSAIDVVVSSIANAQNYAGIIIILFIIIGTLALMQYQKKR